jgi:putative spermidine/putrescine transport system substrate-binding protein
MANTLVRLPSRQDKLDVSSPDRRRVLFGLAGAAAAASLFPGTVLAAPTLEKEVVFACNGGVQEKMFRAIGTSFEKETGVKVNYVIGTMLNQMARIQASRARPDIDVLFGADLTHAAGKTTGLFEKIDTSIVNTGQLYPTALDKDGIGVSCSLTSIGIGYNTEKFKEAGIPAPTSWFDLWDPRLKGKLAICNFGITWIQDFLAIIARLSGGDEGNIKPGIAKIKELKTNGNLAYQPNSPAELENLLTQGLAWITVTASVRTYQLQGQGYPFDFVYPKEGASLYANWLDITKNNPHPNASQAFVNHMLTPEAQMIMAGGLYGPTNRTVTLPPEMARKAPYGEARISSLVPLDRARMNTNLDQWAEAWSREIEAG